MDDFPILLNGVDAEGRTIYVWSDRAYVYRRWTPDDGPLTPGGTGGLQITVDVPDHMKASEFGLCDGGELYTTADGKKCRCLHPYGNPPFPPRDNPCPPCAEAMARRARGETNDTIGTGEAPKGLVRTVLGWLQRK